MIRGHFIYLRSVKIYKVLENIIICKFRVKIISRSVFIQHYSAPRTHHRFQRSIRFIVFKDIYMKKTLVYYLINVNE